MIRRRLYRRTCEDDGVSTSQLAILFPVVLFWLMLIVQYGLWWHTKQVANAAAADAGPGLWSHAKQVANAAAIEAVDVAQLPSGSAPSGAAAAEEYLRQAGNLDGARVTVDRSPTLVTAEVTGNAPQLVPGYSWQVTARSQGPVERFIPEPER